MTYAFNDSLTMLRRNLLHVKRYPIALFVLAIPVVLLLLFVYVFGNTLGTGLEGGGGRARCGAMVRGDHIGQLRVGAAPLQPPLEIREAISKPKRARAGEAGRARRAPST
jgi:hypothetical protein